MIYNLSNIKEKEKADSRYFELRESGKCIELTEKKDERSIQSNKYLHKIIQILGNELGYTLSDMKQLLKLRCPFMHKVLDGEKIPESTKTEQKLFNEFVDWIRNYSSMEHGVYLPTPEEYRENQWNIDKQVNKTNQYQV